MSSDQWVRIVALEERTRNNERKLADLEAKIKQIQDQLLKLGAEIVLSYRS